jgi:hypothetical protein
MIALARTHDHPHSRWFPPLDSLCAKLTTPPAPVSDLGDAASSDGLSGVNLHTNGTEFYGNSSNLAFLGNLYIRAQNQGEHRDQNRPESDVARQAQPVSPKVSRDNGQKRSGRSQLSIVNLLYNADYNDHLSPQSHDGADPAAQRIPTVADGARDRPSPKSNGNTLSFHLESLYCDPTVSDTKQQTTIAAWKQPFLDSQRAHKWRLRKSLLAVISPTNIISTHFFARIDLCSVVKMKHGLLQNAQVFSEEAPNLLGYTLQLLLWGRSMQARMKLLSYTIFASSIPMRATQRSRKIPNLQLWILQNYFLRSLDRHWEICLRVHVWRPLKLLFYW